MLLLNKARLIGAVLNMYYYRDHQDWLKEIITAEGSPFVKRASPIIIIIDVILFVVVWPLSTKFSELVLEAW